MGPGIDCCAAIGGGCCGNCGCCSAALALLTIPWLLYLPQGMEDYFYGNRLVVTGTKVGGFRCADEGAFGKTVVHDNEYYTSSGNVSECGMDLKAWQAKSDDNDKGSTVAAWPKDEVIIGWAKEKLGF